METRYFNNYSHTLGRNMEVKVYGHAGRPVLFLPCQDGRFFDFENFHMTDTWAPWIESGQVMVIAVDTLDPETWSNKYGDNYWRARRYEQWVRYIIDEVAPAIHQMSVERNGVHGNHGIITFGASMGATHALNLFLRFPDIFTGTLSLSGVYTGEFGWENYMDEVVYQNSPVHYMANLPNDHPYIEKYNKADAIICCGRGAWEMPETTERLEQIFREKGIDIWVDWWGYDVNHDWPWWYKQVEYFVPKLLAGKK
ncbi:MAG: esterase family protein [Firmicutes bacterium]|nr:esterase family protein [Bacillota bacterium]MBR7148807.1 esterase family protein [Bacillota bacterium]